MQGDVAGAAAAMASIDDLFTEGFDAWARATGRAYVDYTAGNSEAVLGGLRPDSVGAAAPKDSHLVIETELLRADALAWKGDVAGARRAGDAFAMIGLAYYATYFRWREAEAMLDGGDRPMAAELLKRARAAATTHGFAGLDTALVALARAHQLRLGPARTTIDGDEALSVRELEVLRLVVIGKSNPDIAETLFISRRTAAAHVSNILRKLDATSRVEAVSEAHRRAIV